MTPNSRSTEIRTAVLSSQEPEEAIHWEPVTSDGCLPLLSNLTSAWLTLSGHLGKKGPDSLA